MIDLTRRLAYDVFTRLVTGEAQALEKASLDPRKAQLSQLARIIATNQSTAFSKERGLRPGMSYKDFRLALPISDYEQYRPYIDRMTAGETAVLTSNRPSMFATTSGTTGKRKLIPITCDYLREFRRASRVSCYHMYRYYPAAAAGVALSVVSPAREGLTPSGIPYGAISGALYLAEPEPVRRLVLAVPYEVFSIADYETRYYCILRAALAQKITSIYTLNPSTIVLLSLRLKQYAESLARDLFDGTLKAPQPVPSVVADALKGLTVRTDRALARRISDLLENDRAALVPHRVWPDLVAVSCWTRAAASFYLSDFEELFGSTPVVDITYGASEGRGTVFISPEEEMLAIRSHFSEFVPEDEIESAGPTVLLADEVEAGENYYILMTTSAGLYRYHINDVVKVTGFHNRTPLIEFQYKGGNTFSFTGEKLTEIQVTGAMSETLRTHNLKSRFFTLIPEFRPWPHYRLWLELEPEGRLGFDQVPLAAIEASFDTNLGRMNSEYRAKRSSDRLGAVVCQLMQPGSYESCRKRLVASGVPDSQIKLSHLNPKSEIQEFFRSRLMDLALGARRENTTSGSLR